MGPQVRSQGKQDRPYTLCSGQKPSGAGFSASIIFYEIPSHQCSLFAYQSSVERQWLLKGSKFCQSLLVYDAVNRKIDMSK
jgi:hypothetical protein